MRQPGLGKLEWIEDDKRKAKMQAIKLAKEEAREQKGSKPSKRK
jgi:hypothetical protein